MTKKRRADSNIFSNGATLPQRRSHFPQAAFFAGALFLDRGRAAGLLAVCARLFCNTETRSITLVGLGAFFGFSSISFPHASIFFSITSISAWRNSSRYFLGFHFALMLLIRAVAMSISRLPMAMFFGSRSLLVSA